MLFNSYPFAILVIVTFVFYYLPLFKNHQVTILIASSIIFYGYSQPYLLILLFLSASINAITSYIVFYAKNSNKKRFVALSGVIFNLLVLAFFKYNKLLDGALHFPSDDINQLVQFVIDLPLPVGISFYTFEGISLVMDIYKPIKNYSIEINRNFFNHYKNTLFFIIFFPHLVAGPILKAHDFYPQIKIKHINKIDYYLIIKALIIGYFLKSVIADNLKDQTFWIAAPYFETMSSVTLVVMLYGYSMQIFADFAGYSLIAIAIAALFGYNLPQNFNFPYISKSITEFWRRWHISLSSWLKEYLYISFLGGNRRGRLRTYLNLIIVMFIGGLWHGAALSYGIWGLWHGLGLAVEKLFSRHESPHETHTGLAVSTLRIALVFSFVSFGWLFFKLTNSQEAIAYLISIIENVKLGHKYNIILNIVIYSLPVVIYHAIYLAKNNINLSRYLYRHDYVIYAAMAILILVNGGIPGEFVYFQF